MEEALNQETISDQKAIQFLEEGNALVIRSGKAAGTLLIIDEAGKFLEFASMNPGRQDVFFLQQLAETASRSGSEPLVVICLLHQGFSTYAEQLAKRTQQEWEKVAGRFEEILFHQPLDQIALLAASAINPNAARVPESLRFRVHASLDKAIKLGWYGTSASRDVLRSLPVRLFPIDPTVLPVLVRVFRRFGQKLRKPENVEAIKQRHAELERRLITSLPDKNRYEVD
jgi:hypothetical protein